MVDRHKGRVNYLNAAWLCCFKLKFTLSIGQARRLEQKPRPALGFVDPNFDQARGSDIAVLVANVVRLAQTRCHRFVVQTGVKSFGCEKRTAQESPIHSVEANTSMRCFRLKGRYFFANSQGVRTQSFRFKPVVFKHRTQRLNEPIV
jgi:hypothetical protein